MAIRFDGRVAIVTGAGGGLGREHALALAKLGAKVVVNDLGGALDGTGDSAGAAERVVREIVAAGGEAMANTASVTDEAAVTAMVDDVMKRWGRVDILINNAGILRDKSFAKMTIADFRTVLDVHLVGAAICCKAVWEIMRQQNYGRIVNTTSSTGLYGNFGQANYGAAKMGLVGLTNVLALEGEKYNICVNSFAPTAATRMTEGLMPEATLALLQPGLATPAVLFLSSEGAPTHAVLCAGAGSFERAYVTLTEGIYLADGERTVDALTAAFERISDRTNETVPANGSAQGTLEIAKAQKGATANA